MLLTSLLLDFSNKILTKPISFINSQLEVNQLTQPKLSFIEYQLQITFPYNVNLPKQGQLTFNIPTHSTLQSKVRLQLPPSIGYGINSSYKVEYFEWQRPYEAGRFPHLSKVQKTKVYEEYWRVPTLDKFYLLSHRDYQYYKASNKTETVKLTKSALTQDSLINNLDIIDIKSIKQNGVEFNNWKLVDNSLYWRPYFEPLVNPDPAPSTEPTVAIEWLDGTKPVNGSEYEINYIKPLSLEDIVYVDYTDKSILSNYSYGNPAWFVNNINMV